MYNLNFVSLGLGFFLLAFALFVCPGHTLDTSRQIYQFPNGYFTDIENIAVRSNGDLLLNTITSATTYFLDPSSDSPSAQLLHCYPDANSTVGITEIEPDVFAVVAGNYSAAKYKGIEGSFALWTIDLRNGLPGTPTKVASIPQAQALNGATTVTGSPDLVLVADSFAGAVWRVNITSGDHAQVIQSDLFAPSESFPLGINGIHTQGSTLYFTNSAQGIFGKVPIADDGTATGVVTKLTSPLSSSFKYDDFAFDANGNAYITNHPDTITIVSPSESQVIMAGHNSAFDGPTSAAFGRGSREANCTLYVVTAGSTSTHSGQVISVNTC